MGGGLAQAVEQQQAVGQAGQAVVEGLVQHVGFHLLALGDVARDQYQLGQLARAGADQIGVRFEVPFTLAQHAVLQAPVGFARRRVVDQGAHAIAVVGVDDLEVARIGADGGAELGLVAGAAVQPGAGSVEQGRVVAGVFQDQALDACLPGVGPGRGDCLVRRCLLAPDPDPPLWRHGCGWCVVDLGHGREFRLGRPIESDRHEVGLARQAQAPGAVDEDLHLGLEHLGRDGEEHVVAGADLEAAFPVDVAGAVRGQEHDRGGARAWPQAHQARRLEAVEAGHLDVHEDGAEILPEQTQQRLLARTGGDDLGVKVAQHAAQGEQRAGVVVHQQDGEFPLARGGRGAGLGHGVLRGRAGAGAPVASWAETNRNIVWPALTR